MKNSGFKNFEFKFQADLKPKKSKKSSKKVLYCNLPWNMAVKSNIGKEFLSLVDTFKNTPQGKFINRHTIKLSYSPTRNLNSQIARDNAYYIGQ